MTTYEIRFGRRLRHIREEAEGETRPQLAIAIEVDASAIYRWERGESGPKAAHLARLLRHYRRYQDYLLFGEPGEEPTLVMPPQQARAWSEFLQTVTGREATARGLTFVLSSIPFKHTPTVQTYVQIARALMPDFV